MCVCLRLVLLALLASSATLEGYVNYLMTEPQNPKLQIGTNFTATCLIRNTTDVTADDLRWKFREKEIPKERYRRVNDSAVNVTITITEQTPQWLFCKTDSKDEKFSGKYWHGIWLRKDYLPQKPRNLSCMAVQEGANISPIIHCEWEPKRQPHWDFKTTYTVNLNIQNYKSYNKTTSETSADIDTSLFPNFLMLDIWVEAGNDLGKVESERLSMEANSFAKTNPPSNISIISEASFSSSLLLNWTRPIDRTVLLHLIYEIRFTPEGSSNWFSVPLADTSYDIHSFRLQNLKPDTVHVVQVRCKNEKDGYWSEWSNNATKKTPADKPKSKPDVWQTTSVSESGRQVQILSKEPELANGKILGYKLKIEDYGEKPGQKKKKKTTDPEEESFPVAETDADGITFLKRVLLTEQTHVVARVVAFNSEGESPEAAIVIPEIEKGASPVQRLKGFSDGAQLFLEWSLSNSSGVSEFLIQWVSSKSLDWQREKKHVRKTTIRGHLEKFVRYNVSVYPLYSGWIGKPSHMETYLEQGAPKDGPDIINVTSGCTEAHVTWTKIPLDKQHGFITNFTVFYSDGTKTQEAVTVPSDTFSHTLTNLARNTGYYAWIRVSNAKGSFNGTFYSFNTQKYEPGEIEGIVVGASLGFLFVAVLTLLICFCKREVIKKSFWPEIPNPGESTIGSWSPEYPLKVETPSENCLSGISVLDVDVCDGKSVFEEDKSCLPLKKDKYMSEEHSSGIGGSSCMSSPRQSVSDSDEGGDMAETTASTVQYSSVVASSGYKGQTPCLQPQQAVFSRSESTQPLLESEENPDVLSLEGSRHSQRFSHLSLSHCEGDSESPNLLEMGATGQKTPDFCPVEEDSEEVTSADSPKASGADSSYMPQLGYRPQ